MSEDQILRVDDYAHDAARWLAQAIRTAAEAGTGRVSIALAGGQTPAPVYRELAQHDLPWDRMDLYYGDERCVPEDDPASNHGMVVENLIGPLGDRAPRVFPMNGSRNPQQAARDYEDLLPEALDLAILGMGSDGHTASLFPDAEVLQEQERRVLDARGPSTPAERITLTLVALSAAHRRVLLIRGLDKAHVVSKALSQAPTAHLPVTLVRPATWILDHEASASLSPERVQPWPPEGASS